ncbi:MAG: RNA polymerase sigma factor [Planctomycetota bacterium]|jgi:RNA polymerase sigma factor (sigma-70 family)
MSKRRRVCKPEEVQQVFEEHGSFIHKVIQFQLGHSPDNDDIFQGFFLRLLETPTPRKVMDNRGYLYRMIKNSIITHYQRAKAYERRISRYSEAQVSRTTSYDPTEQTTRIDEFESVIGIINDLLPAHTATALKLRYKNDLTNSAIARNLSVKRETVCQYISAGLRKLRKILKGEHSGSV